MKILMLTPYLPYPLMSGGQTRSYNLIKNLSDKHEITLFSLIKNHKEKKYIQELSKYCKKVSVFKRPKTPWNLRNILLTGFGPYPFLVIRNLALKERLAIKKILAVDKFDLIHAETFYVMPHIPKTTIPILLVEQTIEYTVYKHYIEEQASLFLRPLLWIDVMKLRFWETHYWKQAKMVVAMSDSDKEVMERLSPGLKIKIVPNGIDINHFSEKRTNRSSKKRVLYVGSFTWMQNVEAVELLVVEVWPKIKARVKEAELWIVGTNITEKIKSLESKDIKITERIPDIRDAYSKSSVLVAPIKGPGGTRLKILEAMASSLPVVTTWTGAEGLDLTNGKEALISDDTDSLANSIIEILKDLKLSQRLGLTGKKYVQENYGWEKSAQLLDKIYEEVVNAKKN